MGVSGGFGKGKSHTNSPGKNRGPRHGHGNKSKGGGNAYGTNNVNMTIGQAKQLYANQLAEGISLQDAMRHNKAETVSFYDLLDDKGDSKQSNSNTPNNSTINNNNTMALTANQKAVNDLYQTHFGRSGDFSSPVGASYWSDKVGTAGHSLAEIENALKASSEGKAYAASGNVNPGGVLSGAGNSIFGQNDGTNTFLDSVSGKGYDISDELNKISANTGGAGGYFQISDDELKALQGGGGGTTNTTTVVPSTGWWSQFADADAFKKFLQGDTTKDATTQASGMDDFMKFMMLMSVMGGGRGGGGGYGGSQYGYGGLNPGGVQAAYNPLENLQGMGDWFNNNFGSNSGASTATVNAT